jgi:hypothetical protein
VRHLSQLAAIQKKIDIFSIKSLFIPGSRDVGFLIALSLLTVNGFSRAVLQLAVIGD